MSADAELNIATKVLEHDIRNQLGNIYLAVEGIKAEFAETNNEDFSSYTDIIINCCKQVENIIRQIKTK
ncbi:MAG: histidine kinase dimerization/phospho-acceptor domain-containing protein [Janthinobacterium lividum]